MLELEQEQKTYRSRVPSARSATLEAIVVEDEKRVGDLLQTLLEQCGFHCHRTLTAETAETLLDILEPDLLLIDLILPGASGSDLLRRYRGGGGDAPVVVVSAVNDVMVRAELLSSHADDFIVKPFNVDELQSRVRAVMRRTRSQRFLWRGDGHFRLDPATCTVGYDDRGVSVTPVQFGIIWILAAANKRPVHIEELCDQLFGNALPETVAKCHAHISKLRRELRRLGPEVQLPCIVSVGYLLSYGARR